MSKPMTLIKKYLKYSKIDKYLTQRNFDYCLLFLSIIIGMYLNWDIIYLILFPLLVWQILHPVSRQVIVKITLLLFLFLPIVGFFKIETGANVLAIIGYCLLLLISIMLISEHREKGEDEKPS